MAQLRKKADIISRLTGAGKTPPTGRAFDEMTVPELKAFARSEGVDLTALVAPPPPPKKRTWMGGPRKSRPRKEKGLLHRLTHKREDW